LVLAAKTEMDERTVRLALTDLVRRGLISREPQYLDGTKYRRSDLFTLHLTSDATTHPGETPGYIRASHPVHPGESPGHIEPEDNQKVEPEKNQTRGARALAIVDQSFDKEFDDHFWPLYPNKVDKLKARKAFVKARRGVALADIMGGLKRYVDAHPVDYQYWKGPAAWLTGERWNDQPAKPSHGPVVDGILRAGEKWLIDLEEARRLKAQGAVS
jgi:hypothetical protein